MRWSTGTIFITTRPATIIKSHWRGENRNASAPNRAMSCLEAPVAMSSIPQHAVAKGMGQRLFFLHQLAMSLSLVTKMLSPRKSSSATETPLCGKRKYKQLQGLQRKAKPRRTQCLQNRQGWPGIRRPQPQPTDKGKGVQYRKPRRESQ